MKHHIVLKFLAILLCAGMLLGCLACGLGMLALNEAGVYRQGWAAAYHSYRISVLENAAYGIALRHGAESLGGLDKYMLSAYCGDSWYLSAFRAGEYGYAIVDGAGNTLTGTELPEGQFWEEISIPLEDLEYPVLLAAISREEYDAAMNPTEPVPDESEPGQPLRDSAAVYDAIPEEGAEVTMITVGYADGSEGVGAPNSLGMLHRDSEGRVFFQAQDAGLLEVDSERVLLSIRFESTELGLLYENTDPQGVGQLAVDDQGILTFVSDIPETAPDLDPAPVETGEVTEVVPYYALPTRDSEPLGDLEAGSAVEILSIVNVQGEDWVQISQGWLPMESISVQAEAAAAAETPAAMSRQTIPAGRYLDYYDPSRGEEMVLCYSLSELTGCSVVFYLTDYALREDTTWLALGMLNTFRDYLLPGIVACGLLFAVLAVYLCCAAGRSPGTKAVRAGGLNRLPLDIWVLLDLCAVALIALALVEGTPELLEGSVVLGLAYAACVSYTAAVLAVCFCFTCAAQFKTPEGFWWRNLLCVRCVALMGRGAGIVAPWAGNMLGGLWQIIRVLAMLLWEWGRMALDFAGKHLRRLSAAAVRFCGQLPMTWQWLLAGFLLIILLALTVDTRFSFWGILVAVAMVLYGAHAFGTLLGAVKRMNKGDLNVKADDKLLIGCFRDFAWELNSLADVAVTAAEKQLRSERMKTELITNVSHDIKTPLTSIINYVDLLEKPHTPQEQAVYLEVLSRQSLRLKKLIEDLMELSKASTGNMAVDIRQMDAAETVNQALGEFADKLEAAGLIPVFRQPEQSILMRADGRLVWRVLSNLMSNAVKYALPGTRLYVDLMAVEGKVILSLKNISRESLNVHSEELLERFVRGDVSRNTEGSGLGLNIAKSLMEVQGGSLQLLVDGDLFKVTLIFPGV